MLRPRRSVAKLVPATHGGINYSELERLGISPESIIDFSVSTNPFGPPPGIKEAMEPAPVDRYPDSEATGLRMVLAEKTSLSPDNILIGSGSTELIRLVASAYLDMRDLVLIPQPTYGEYEVACHLVGARVLKQNTREEAGFRLDLAETVALMHKHRPRGIFLCNPNNPTGQYLNKDSLEQVLSAAPNSLVVLDEAYLAFTENSWVSTDLINQGNLVILRSMTKDYALAGLRLGYAIAAGPIISILRRVKPPWNVSVVAQTAGIFALKAGDYLDTCGMKVKQAKDFLIEGLSGLGLSPLPSQANFFLVKVDDAARLRQALLKKGILVRDCASFGLSDYIRLAPRAIPDCQRLLSAIKDAGV